MEIFYTTQRLSHRNIARVLARRAPTGRYFQGGLEVDYPGGGRRKHIPVMTGGQTPPLGKV